MSTNPKAIDPMSTDIEKMYKPVSSLSEEELAQLKAKLAEMKRTGAILDLSPFDTRKFVTINNDTVREVARTLGADVVNKTT